MSETRKALAAKNVAMMAEQEHRAECFDDLLEALKLFAYIDQTTGSDLWWIDKRRCIQARAAIAKATGETA